MVLTVDEGYAGQPQKRATMTVDRASGSTAKVETFQDPGQTVAGVVSAGGAVLVYTGIALALRRFAAWIARRRSSEGRVESKRAA